MASKIPKPKRSSWIDIFKSQRGEPIPPKRVIQPDEAPGPTEADWEEDTELEVCVYCGESRESAEFTDGLRCDVCRAEDEYVLDEFYPPDIGGEG